MEMILNDYLKYQICAIKECKTHLPQPILGPLSGDSSNGGAKMASEEREKAKNLPGALS